MVQGQKYKVAEGKPAVFRFAKCLFNEKSLPESASRRLFSCKQ
jgi:hypothetical protein